MREIPFDTKLDKIRALNPHWDTGSIDPEIRKLRKRRYFDLLLPLVSEPSVLRAIVVMGPRRVGKTILLHQLIQHLIEHGHDPNRLVYLPLDNPLLQGHALEELVQLYARTGRADTLHGCTVIFDEVQYLDDWSVHLKVLVDTHKQTKFIATGSAAAALRLKSRESGAGRFTDFVLPPLTFYEFLDLQGLIDTQFSFDESGMPHPNDIESLNSHFIDYINYGGYPEALFSEAIRNNPERYIRSDIIEKVLLRDLPSLYGIQDIRELSRLFYTLAYQTGMEVTYSDLSSSAEVAANTVKKYIEFLESAFLIRTVNRIDNSAKTFQKINFFKVYLTNPSIYTALFGLVDKGQNIGNLVETALYCQAMHSRLFQNLHYARWKKGPHAGEVDFVCLNNNFKVSICLESKWSDNKIDLKGFRYFCTKNKSTYCFVATKSRFGYKEDESGMNISFFPAAWLAFHIGLMEFDDKQEDLASALESIRNERPDQMALFAQDT